MATCTFFGHRSITKEIEPTLRATLVDLIENKGVKMFYVGNHGDFDFMVQRVLKDLSADYPIVCYVVLAYMPEKNSRETFILDTIFADGLESAPKRFAISYRNKWMIERADYVVTYVTHEIGSGAAQFKALAKRKNKIVFEIS